MLSKDTVQRFLFEESSIRGELAHIDDTFLQIIQQRNYPPQVKKFLSEAILSCILLVGSIKFEGELSLQFQGDKRLPLILVQCDNDLHVRAFAQYQEALKDDDYADAFLHGKMVLTLNQYKQTQSYQSIVPILSASMSQNLMHYFSQSEQISSHVLLVVGKQRAAGMLLQLMPGPNGNSSEQESVKREQFWEYAVVLGQTLSEEELLQLNNETILHRLYHETTLRLFEPRMIRFQCRCSLEKMKQVFNILGEEEAKALIAERGTVEIRCEFCNHLYTFDAIDVTMMFHKLH